MKKIDKLIHSAITAFLALAATHTMATTQEMNAPNNMEKCYGMVKAGMNDCATAKQSCAGSATKDAEGDAFIFLPKGTCTKIVGGELKAKEEKKS